jgi:SAM-dependent methyltransferase
MTMKGVELPQEHIEYFGRGRRENPRFWARLGGAPSFKGASVADVGCGHGSLCIDIAMSGAKKVVGFDINTQLIDFANENLRQNYPQLVKTVEFENMDLRDYREQTFDYIVSKDTLEHVIDLDAMLNEMKTRLNYGGRIYAGFGPLWNSPFGDHRRTKTPIPWGHLLITEDKIIDKLNRGRQKKIDSIYDLGLNKMSLNEYRNLLSGLGLSIIYYRVNASACARALSRPLIKISDLLRKIHCLEEYFSFNLYFVLERT